MIQTLAVLACWIAVHTPARGGELTHHAKPGSPTSYAVTVVRGDLAFTRQILAVDAD